MGGRNITRNQARANALRKQQGDGITLSRHQRRTKASRSVRVPSAKCSDCSGNWSRWSLRGAGRTCEACRAAAESKVPCQHNCSADLPSP